MPTTKDMQAAQFYFPRKTYHLLKLRAKKEGKSMNKWVLEKMEKELKKKEKKPLTIAEILGDDIFIHGDNTPSQERQHQRKRSELDQDSSKINHTSNSFKQHLTTSNKPGKPSKTFPRTIFPMSIACSSRWPKNSNAKCLPSIRN